MESLPPREAWIEIAISRGDVDGMSSLPPREAWIEIVSLSECSRSLGRFPRGKRGLKFLRR